MAEARMADYEGRPAPDEYGAFYADYVDRVPREGGLVALLGSQVEATVRLLEGLSDAEANHAYAPPGGALPGAVAHGPLNP